MVYNSLINKLKSLTVGELKERARKLNLDVKREDGKSKAPLKIDYVNAIYKKESKLTSKKLIKKIIPFIEKKQNEEDEEDNEDEKKKERKKLKDEERKLRVTVDYVKDVVP